MKTFGLVGWSGSGKTTLIARLLPELIGRGLAVSTMKHTHHSVDVDRPGKDTYVHREAGATEVMLASSSRWALMHENRSGAEPEMDDLIAQMSPVDLVLIEGFKRHRHAKLEVHRSSLGRPLICVGDPTVVAVASDTPLSGLRHPVLDLDDARAIADFIVGYCGLRGEGCHGAAG